MGYNTCFKITATAPKVDVASLPMASEIAGFFNERGCDKIDEHSIAALIAKFPKYFNVPKITYGQLETHLEAISGKQFVFGSESEPCKWYDCEKDMKALSLEYPTVTFTVYGDGEESGDIWRATVKNGVWEEKKAKIVFEE